MRLAVGDVRLHVSVAGEEWQDGVRRPTIVAVHGGPGVDGTKLRWLMRPAADYAQVIVPDQRGHGRSDRSDPACWTLDAWADDLAALIEVLGVERPVVLGSSFGGFVIQRYLARHPDQPGGAILVGTCARLPGQDATVERFRALGGDEAAAAVARSFREETPEAETEWTRVCEPLMARLAPPKDLTRVLEYQVVTPEVGWSFSRTLATMDLRSGLASARCPVLLLVGTADPLIPVEAAMETIAALPSGLGELRTFPDAAHDVFIDVPEEAHAAVRRFVLQCQATAPAP